MTALLGLSRLHVAVDGEPLAARDAEALGEVRVQQRLSLPAACELAFFDPRGPIAEGRGIRPGVRLELRVQDRVEPLFSGDVTAVEFQYGPSGGREIHVRGYDRLHVLRKRQPVRAHVQVTLEELARELVSDLGLDVEAEDTGPVWEKLVQHRQSDLELMQEVADRCGLYFTLRGGRLHLLSLAGRGDPVRLVLGESLLEARVDLNADRACRSVEALGWDPWYAQSHRGEAARPRQEHRLRAIASPDGVGAGGERTLVDEAVQSDAQAAALAQAELDHRAAGDATLWGIAEGDPQLQPGRPVDVEGMAPALSGRYLLTSVTHTLDRRRGFLSEIDSAPPPPRNRSPAAVSTLGVVTRVDDPERLGRVRVALPTMGDLETDWLEVLSPGAGQDKGLVVPPDVDDRVLVLLAREDPAQAVVLGGLYGREGPPDPGVEEGTIRRYTFRTPGGQQVRLDDGRRSVRVENESGSYLQLAGSRARVAIGDGSRIELTRDGVQLHCETDLTIEAPGRSIVIRAGSIDFERG